jgi:hypothetical protein
MSITLNDLPNINVRHPPNMKKTLLILTAALGPTISAYAQYSQYGAVDEFFKVNVEINAGNYAGREVNPTYWYVDYNRLNEYDGRMTGGGFVRLGISNWSCDLYPDGGIPLKMFALAYAHTIGADVILYATRSSTEGNNRIEHYVAFYAKDHSTQASTSTGTNRPTGEAIKRAMNRIQDILHKPRIKSEVLYDEATDSYSWIGPAFGKPMSKAADEVLERLRSFKH